MSNVLDEIQKKISEWATRCFGTDQVSNPKTRGLRMAEEVIEFNQAVGVHPEKLHELIDYVYSRPPGKPYQELGGVALTSLVAAQSINVSFMTALQIEVDRVTSKPPEHFAQRNKVKCDAGFTE